MFAGFSMVNWELLPESLQEMLVQRTRLTREESDAIKVLTDGFYRWVSKEEYKKLLRARPVFGTEKVEEFRRKLQASTEFTPALDKLTELVRQNLAKQLREEILTEKQVSQLIKRDEVDLQNRMAEEQARQIEEEIEAEGNAWLTAIRKEEEVATEKALEHKRLQIEILKAQLERERQELANEKAESQTLDDFLEKLGISK